MLMKPVPLSPQLLTTTHTCFLKAVGEKQQHVKNPELLLQPPPGPHHHLLVLLSSTPHPHPSDPSAPAAPLPLLTALRAVQCLSTRWAEAPSVVQFLTPRQQTQSLEQHFNFLPHKENKNITCVGCFSPVSDFFWSGPCWGFLFKCIKQVQPHPLR